MSTQLKRGFLALVIAYGIILGGLGYWHLFADLQGHSADPRSYLIFEEYRAPILDRYGRPLAFSEVADGVFVRRYATPFLAHVVGYFHPRFGLIGLERIYHQELSKGRSLYTTIDLEIQELAEEIFGERVGAVVVIRPDSGEILALVSGPAVDSNVLEENWADYLADLRSPFLNRVTQGLYAPGSVVKPLVYGAALDEKLTEPGREWLDQGSLVIGEQSLANYGGKALGKISTDQALALSSNVVFAQLAMALGPDLSRYYQAFGLGSPCQLELTNGRGSVPEIDSPYTAALLGIGQGDLLVTPLQIGLAAAAIANRGTLMEPYLVAELRGGWRLRRITRPRSRGYALSEQTALIVRDAMILGVEEGTARGVYSEKGFLAAKTGTAQTAQGADHSWFMGFAPSGDPQVAGAVIVEHGGSGSTGATPLGAAILAGAVRIEEERKNKR